MSLELINIWYIVAAALFVFGLKQLGSPATAVRGNTLSALGMLIAVAVTLFNAEILSFTWILVATLAGGIIGAVAAQKVQMTSMPEMVALFNGSGGIASLLVGWAALYNVGNTTFTDITIVLSILIGGMTFTGSILAWGKLSEVMTSRAVVFGAQRNFNGLLVVAIFACAVMFVLDPSPNSPYLFAVIGLACLFGVMAVLPIGGADMPVVISLLNSYSGLAACAA
ncbi:MAG: NAD(P)(+) transhydrogenase (Re/Si-specific) subunit beta, partial [Pseudomonadales bacterium]